VKRKGDEGLKKLRMKYMSAVGAQQETPVVEDTYFM